MQRPKDRETGGNKIYGNKFIGVCSAEWTTMLSTAVIELGFWSKAWLLCRCHLAQSNRLQSAMKLRAMRSRTANAGHDVSRKIYDPSCDVSSSRTMRPMIQMFLLNSIFMRIAFRLQQRSCTSPYVHSMRDSHYCEGGYSMCWQTVRNGPTWSSRSIHKFRIGRLTSRYIWVDFALRQSLCDQSNVYMISKKKKNKFSRSQAIEEKKKKKQCQSFCVAKRVHNVITGARARISIVQTNSSFK